MFLIDTQNKKAISLEKYSFSELKLSERNDLQEWIIDNPDILGESLLIIQKEFAGFSETNERLDLLALDENGKLVIIENKIDDSGKDVVWQSLKYASYCATLTKSQICEIYQRYLGKTGDAKDKIAEFYDEQDYENIHLNLIEGKQRIILVAANFRKEVTSTVLWLRNYHGVDITCIKVTPYKDENKLYLDVEQIIPMKDALDYQIRLTAKKQEEAVSSKDATEGENLRYLFWEKALPVVREKSGIFNNVSPTKYNWLRGASGRSGIAFCLIVNKNDARAELFIRTGDVDKNKAIFDHLEANKNEIQNHFDLELYWRGERELTKNIGVHYKNYGFADEKHWDEIVEFLADNVSRLIKAFKPLLDAIPKD